MAKKDSINIETTGVDRLEYFLQKNLKVILLVITLLVAAFIIGYIAYESYLSSQKNKQEIIGAQELILLDVASVKTFSEIAAKVPSQKDYIALRSAGMFERYDADNESISELQKVTGNLKELSDGMLYDLGGKVDPSKYLTGTMPELWHYRNVLSSTPENVQKNIDAFKVTYPNSKLLELVQNWNIK